jgi:hypothetical protein
VPKQIKPFKVMKGKEVDGALKQLMQIVSSLSPLHSQSTTISVLITKHQKASNKQFNWMLKPHV